MEDSPAIALVSGASSGLGAALVSELTGRGCDVIAVARNRDRLAAVADEAGGRVITHTCDVGSYDQVVALARRATSYGSVKYVLHAAGEPAFAKIRDIDAPLLERALAANLRGLVYLTSQFLDVIKDNGDGAIVGILSTAALTGRPDEAAYAAAKWGARGFLECLRAACKGTGVRVISVFPGGMNTPFWSRQTHLKPKLDTYMDPRNLTKPIVDAAFGIDMGGYVSSLVIERT